MENASPWAAIFLHFHRVMCLRICVRICFFFHYVSYLFCLLVFPVSLSQVAFKLLLQDAKIVISRSFSLAFAASVPTFPENP